MLNFPRKKLLDVDTGYRSRLHNPIKLIKKKSEVKTELIRVHFESVDIVSNIFGLA
jgi:hypothetical protein